ncbi:MAG: UvrD-helicase domain-containing protein [Candidatus Omnitrophota bacterium]
MKKKNSSLISFPEVKIVEASAGSGKTYTLARRYIQLLINSRLAPGEIPLRNILAITFTLKATREMRERILELLKKIALNAFSSLEEKNDLLASLGVPEEEAQERAFRILDFIINNYNFFQVKNIDKFINVILSGCALELNLSANFRIKENYSNYVAYALDETIDQVQINEKTKKIFSEFINQYLHLENRLSWFAKNDILEILKGLFYQSNIFGGNFKKFPVDSNELINLKQKVLTILQNIHAQAPEGMNKLFFNSLAKFLENNTKAFNLGSFKSQKFYQDVLPMNKGQKASTKLERLWQEFRALIVTVSEKEALSLFNCYIDIYEEVYGFFRQLARQDDVLFMEELNKQVRFLFKETKLSVPELYYRLASKFRHFLIDEFQDTSKLQWDNLFLMVEDALSTGGSLFYVGDKKQAIYRFRGGDVNLFEDIKQEFSKFNINGALILKTNYRSQKQVVEFNNLVFSQANLKRFLDTQQAQEKDELRWFTDEEINEILAVFKDSNQESRPDKSQGYVKVEYIEYTDKDEKDELIRVKLMATIQNLKARFPLKSIAILCRSNREIELVTGWLTEEKINVESERTLNITNNSLIRELIAFLKFLNSPLDTISFCAFILGDIFLKVSGLEFQQVSNFIFEFNPKKNKWSLYRTFKKQFSEIWNKYIDDFFKSVGFVSLYELMVSILDKFKVLDNFSPNQGFFMRLLELIREQEQENSDIALLLEFLDSAPEQHLYVNFSDENSIKVMTIHKAKGLGFSVVLVPFLDMNIRELGAQIKRVRAPYVVYEKESENNFGLLRLDAKYAKFSRRIREIYRQEYRKSFIDELNVIYVTFTRAECELYLFVPCFKSEVLQPNNSVMFLIPENFQEKGCKTEYNLKQVPDKYLIMPIVAAKYYNWVNILKEEFAQGTQLKNRKNIMRGEILHYLLKSAENLNEQRLDQLLDILENKLNFEFSGLEKPDQYIKIVKNILTSEMTKKFFYLDGVKTQVYTEKEYVDKSGRTFRLDRLILTEQEAWVIDFKSSKENRKEHIEQIQEYKNIISSIYAKKKICGFLVYMEEIKVEQI